MTTNLNQQVASLQLRRRFVKRLNGCKWHVELLAIIARHYRCVVTVRCGLLFIAGHDSELVEDAIDMFWSTLKSFRATARQMGARTWAEKVEIYRVMLPQLAEMLVQRHLPTVTAIYAYRHPTYLNA